MTILFAASHQPGAGKTAIAAGVAAALARTGARVAACKPLSPAGRTDPDAVYFAGRFRGGVAVTSTDDDAGLDAAANAVSSLLGVNDHVLVEVANPVAGSGLTSALTTGLAARLPARVLAIFDYQSDLSAAAITGGVAPLGDALAGIIINRTPRYRSGHAEALLAEVNAAGIPALAYLPENRDMLSVTMEQLAHHLNGRWELAPDDGDEWVGRFLIGGNIMDSGQGYFGRFAHQAVITRAERPDIQLACLMQDTRCLVLTGGARPTEYIRVEAAKRSVPVLLVDGNTVATADAVGDMMGAVVSHSPHKAELMAGLLAERMDVSALLG